MKAMVLAAGLGTRLRPLTSDRPKALVEVAGKTLLEITLARLRQFGVDRAIVNSHHFAPQMRLFVETHDFGMPVAISEEPDLLDTGGGLRKAAPFFLADGDDSPFILHNVDVLSAIDLAAMLRQHVAQQSLATLAVQQRPGSRQLFFNSQDMLCGRRTPDGDEWATLAADAQLLAFTGIHILSPEIFGRFSEDGAFSIISAYLRLAAEGEKIAAYRADGVYWRDLGKLESLSEAEKDIAFSAFCLPT